MTPLRVAHVTGERAFSGGEVQMFLLMEGLRARGHESVLVCPPATGAEREAQRRGFPVAPVEMRNDFSLGAARRIAAELRERAPALVHCHTGRANWLGGLGARWAGVPALTTRRMDRRVKRGLRTRYLYRHLMRRAVAISPAVERRLIEAGVPAQRISVIWSAIDPGAVVPCAPRELVREHLDAPAGVPCLLVAANLVHRKGVDVLLRALARITAPCTLWVAGDGIERVALKALAHELDIAERVRFLGPRMDVPDLLEACEVFVLPSRQEGLGVAALEAMARARPVVASAVGGLAELVQDGVTGLLVPAGDAAALGSALEQLIADPERAQRMGDAGAARVADGFLAEQMVAAYETLYRDILAERGAAEHAT